MIRSLAKRFSIYFITLLIGKIISFFVFIIYARALSPTLFGEFILFITLIQLVTFIADFGLVQWYQKHMHNTKDHENQFIYVIYSRLTTLFISLIFVLIFTKLTQTFSREFNIYLILTLIFESLLSVSDGYYFAIHQAYRVSNKTLFRMLLLLGAFFYVHPKNLSNVILVYFLATFITCLAYIPWKSISLQPYIFKEIIGILKKSSPYGALIFTSFVYSRGDSILISYLAGSSALGVYSAAYRFLESISLMSSAISHTLFPIASKEGSVTKKQTLTITYSFLIIGIFLSCFLYFMAEKLILFLLGTEYEKAISILKILSIAVILFFVNAPLNTVVQSSKKLKGFLPFGIINTLLNIILNLFFIPIYGIYASAVIMVLTEFTGLIINMIFINKIYAKN